MPIPEHISARAEDLQNLIEKLVDFYKQASDEMDPVSAAACLAFGFVYVHPFEDGNGRMHRFFDATLHTEILYSCVEQTIEKDLPAEIEFLKKYDEFRREVKTIVDMPEKTINLLFRFLRQTNGILSKRALEKEFKPLRNDEVERIQRKWNVLF